MSNLNLTNPKRRPVDLLFGEIDDDSQDLSMPFQKEGVGMAVQHDGRAGDDAPASALSMPQSPACASSGSELVLGPVATTVLKTPTTTTGETEPTMSVLSPNASPERSDKYRSLASTIDSLYRQMAEGAIDSPKLREHCLSLLIEAGSALESEEYAQAGYGMQQVEARLLRASLNEKMARSSKLKLIWAWKIAVGLGAVAAIMVPFYVVLVPGIVPLIRAIAFGALGGNFVPLGILPSRLRDHGHVPPFVSEHWASPLKGALIGGVVFLFSQLGVIAAPGALGLSRISGSLSGAHLVMYVFALMAGLGSDKIFDFIHDALRFVPRLPVGFSSIADFR